MIQPTVKEQKRKIAPHFDPREVDTITYEEWLKSRDLVDAVYAGGVYLNIADDPAIILSPVRYHSFIDSFMSREIEIDSTLTTELEDLLEEPRIDKTKRVEPRVLVVCDDTTLHSQIERQIKSMLPMEYSFGIVSYLDDFIDNFYSGIDDAIPSLIIGTEFMRFTISDREHYMVVHTDLKKVCKRRKIPFISFMTYQSLEDLDVSRNLSGSAKLKEWKYWNWNEREKLKRYSAGLDTPVESTQKELTRALKKLGRVNRRLPPIDPQNMARLFGTMYPTGYFLDGGERKEFPYAIFEGKRVPLIATVSTVVEDHGLVLMMQEAKKGYDPKESTRGKWDLPGGRIDTDSPAIVAIRELSEETGYHGELHSLLGVMTYMNPRGKMIMRASYRGNAVGRDEQTLAPDSLGHGFFDPDSIEYFHEKGLLKDEVIRRILAQAHLETAFELDAIDRHQALIRL